MKNDVFTPEGTLTEIEMLKLDLYQSRVDLRSAIIEKLTLREKMEEIEHRRTMKEIFKQKQDLLAELDQYKQDYNNLFVEIQKRLDINLEEYTIQEDGSLRYIGDMKTNKTEEVPD